MLFDDMPQVNSPDFVTTGERLGRELCVRGYVLLKLGSREQKHLAATQRVLKSVTKDFEQPLQPSKQNPGRLTYSYSLGQDTRGVPERWSCTAAQACNVLRLLAEAVLTSLTQTSILTVRTTAFNDILDDAVLPPGQKSSSVLDAIQYMPSHAATGNCPPHVDKGLLTVISANADGLQIFSPYLKLVQKVDVPPGYVAILPGYTLERVTCGLIQAAVHRVVLESTASHGRTALAFKLRAMSSAVLNLYPQLPCSVKTYIHPRYAGPISVAELMWVFSQTHESINDASSTAMAEDIPAAVSVRAAQLIETNRLNMQGVRDALNPFLKDTVQVFVKNLVGRTLTIQIDLEWPTWCFKKCIEDKDGVPASDMRLIFLGKLLEDMLTLRYYKLEKESTVHLVLGCRGD